MPYGGGITVTGIPEIQRNLANFPRVLVMGCFAKALSRAAGVFEEELRARCPETDFSTSSDEYGHLVDNLMSTVTIDTGGQGGRASIGFGRKGMVALWVEYGHRQVTGGKLSRKGSGPGRETGFTPPHPFMRQAFEAAADRAVDVIIETIQEFMQSGEIAA
jgi:hypothetical protein